MISNVRELLEQRAAATPEKTFLFSETDDRAWSYSEFDSAVNRTANMLYANGISKGDVVSLLLPNSPEYIISYFACWKIGALAGPVNSLLKTEEIEWVVGNSEAKLMLIGSEFASGRLEPPAIAGGSNKSPREPNYSPKPHPAVADGPGLCPRIIFDRVSVADEFSGDLDPVDLNSDDEAIIIYTSGTTGKPKGCLLTHGNLIANAKQITEWMGFTEADRLLTIMPLFHMNAVSVTTMTALYAGASTVVSPKFSASRFWDIIEKYQITSFGSVATMLSMLLAKCDAEDTRDTETRGHGDTEIRTVSPRPRVPASDRLRFAMCGSAPVPAEVLRTFEETFGVLVIEGYGLSESTCRSTFNPPTEKRRPGSCGQPIGNEMKVFDENDEEVPDNELGEIVLRGPNIFKAYFKNPDATAKAFGNGWFHTGDVGYRDPDGFFYIADRKSDMIIRGGENIYPREIDDLLYTHPAIAAAAVIGVADELYGEEVAAFVVLKNGSKISAGELIKFCQTHLADYKCPKSVHFVDDIPKGPTGKLLKRELARLFKNRG
ncbi:MAG: long-chain-fatty-acid--CoA ligase [Acidobacteria bacterium]|nr:MAG: long-chain-fatty-acid--CoA ligase [Acidobacteriota bacterium]